MKHIILTVLFLCGFLIVSNAQTEYPTKNDEYIFWQPNTEINFSDYQAAIDSSAIRLHEKYGMQLISTIKLMSVIDIPKKKRQRGAKTEIVYFAPAFCKKCSSIFSKDGVDLKYDRLFFDIAELCARQARIELDAALNEIYAYGTLSIMYMTVKSRWEERMHEMFGAFGNEVIVEKKRKRI